MSTLLGAKDYLSWTHSSAIVRATRHFHRGEPFQTSLYAVELTLQDIVAVRNRFVHRSDYSAQQFHSVVKRVFGFTPRGINPGRFLLKKDPTGSGLTFLEIYANTLLGAANLIVP
ncbi:MAG: hypothetical protein L0332_32490 [Chloroflexi bacterium]|nr:hypothetical protein [Chloroflexota bacterium]